MSDIDVSAEAVLPIVVRQRDKALTDLAVAQAAVAQQAARIRELEAVAAEQGQQRRPHAVTGTD